MTVEFEAIAGSLCGVWEALYLTTEVRPRPALLYYNANNQTYNNTDLMLGY